MKEILVVLTNCPDEASAERIARALVEGRLAACASLMAPAVSIYRWEGEVEEAEEIPLFVKCTRERYAQVEAAIRELHPYTTPEIIALPVVAGFAPYLRWVDEETQPPLVA